MGCPACPASCKGPALSYIPPSSRAATLHRVSVLSSLTVLPGQYALLMEHRDIQKADRLQISSRLPANDSPCCAASVRADQHFGFQHRGPNIVSPYLVAPNNNRGAARVLFPGHAEAQEAQDALACRGQNRSVANIRWPTSSLAHLTVSRPPPLLAPAKAVPASPLRWELWRGLGPAVALPDVALRGAARRASGKMLTGARQLLACHSPAPLHLGRRGDLHSWDPHGSAFAYPLLLPPTGTVRIARRLVLLALLVLLQPCWPLLAPCPVATGVQYRRTR